eukprot:SAG11_NODE_13225_length_665_cov_0.697880_1_plen_30_part_01
MVFWIIWGGCVRTPPNYYYCIKIPIVGFI